MVQVACMSYGFTWIIVLGVLGAILLAFAIAAFLMRRFLGREGKQPTSIVRFLIRYVVAFGLLLGLETLLLWAFPSFHESLRGGVAALVGGILHLFGTEAQVAGPLITIGSSSLVFDVTAACLGGLLFWMYLALVFAEPRAANRQRLKGGLIGLGFLLAFNLSRIVLSVYFEGTTGLRVHDWFYLVNILVVLMIWAGWVRTLRPALT